MTRDEYLEILGFLDSYDKKVNHEVRQSYSELISKYILYHVPPDVVGHWGKKLFPAFQILIGLSPAEQARILAEANGYQAVISSERGWGKKAEGIIVFSPEGKALITADQFAAEWKGRYKKKYESDMQPAMTMGNKDEEVQENSEEWGKTAIMPQADEKISAPVENLNQGMPNRDTQSSVDYDDANTAKGQNLQIQPYETRAVYRLENGVVQQYVERYMPVLWVSDEEAISCSDPSMASAVSSASKCDSPFVEYKDQMTQVKVPSFLAWPPSSDVFMEIMRWYKTYVRNYPRGKQYKRHYDLSIVFYRNIIATHAAVILVKDENFIKTQCYCKECKPDSLMSDRKHCLECQIPQIQRLLECMPVFLMLERVNFFEFRIPQIQRLLGLGNIVNEASFDRTQQNVGGSIFDGVYHGMDACSLDPCWLLCAWKDGFQNLERGYSEYVKQLTGCNFEAFLSLLEIFGRAFLGKEFLSTISRNKKRVTVIETDDPDVMALLLQKIIFAGQAYYYCGNYGNFRWQQRQEKVNIPLLPWEQLRAEAIKRVHRKSIMRNYGVERLQEKYGPAFMIDSYLGATINVSSDIGPAMGEKIDWRFLRKLILGKSVSFSVMRDGRKDRQHEANRFFDAVSFHSDMQYVFTTTSAKNFLNKMDIDRTKVRILSIHGPIPGLSSLENMLGYEIAFWFVLMGMYYVIDKEFLHRSWLDGMENSSANTEQIRISFDKAVQKFMAECCEDQTGQVAQEFTDADWEDCRMQRERSGKERSEWQKKTTISALKTDSRENIYSIFCVWCEIYHVRINEKVSASGLFQNLAKHIKVAQYFPEADKLDVYIKGFSGRPSVQDKWKYWQKVPKWLWDHMSAESFEILQKKDDNAPKSRNDNQSNIIYGVSLNADKVEKLLKELSVLQEEDKEERRKDEFDRKLRFLIGYLEEDILEIEYGIKSPASKENK